MDVAQMLKSNHNKNETFLFYLILFISCMTHVVTLYLGKTSLSEWRFIHDPLHSVTEVSGSLIAIAVAYILHLHEKLNRGTSYNKIISFSLIGMGLFDGLHALFHAGHHFVLFHSLATFVGGCLFSLILLPTNLRQKVSATPVWKVLTSLIIIVVISLLIPVEDIRMVKNGEFTGAAVFLNITGGMLLLLSAFKLFYTYQKNHNFDDVLFSLHCLLFGLAALMFQESKLWDFPWWSWHILRLAAYVTALFFAFKAQKDIQMDLTIMKANEILNNTEEAAKIGSWRLSLSDNSLFWSDQTYRIHELEIGSPTVLDTAMDYYHPDDVHKLEFVINRAIETGQPWDEEFRFITAKNNKLWVRTIGRAYRESDGTPYLLEGSIQDITDAKNKEKELRHAKVVAERAEKAKTNFLANMSHEIRTPLNGVLGTVELLNDTQLSEKQKGMLQTISTCGKSLLELINNILDYSKIDSGKVEIETIEFSLNDCLNDAATVVSSKLKEKNIQLKFEYPKNEGNKKIYIFSDYVRIKQIVINYLSNAIKFTTEGIVTLGYHIDYLDEDICDLSIYVKDEGIGISSEAAKKLFNTFVQADESTTRKFGGTGLGLSICLKLAKLLNAKVYFENRETRGTIFYLDLNVPYKASLAPLTDTIDNKATGSPLPSKILVAEDNKINQKIIKAMLEKLGIECDIAVNGIEACDRVDKMGPDFYDVILMDMQMPEMDGLEATTKIIAQHGSLSPKIIALTANAFSSDKEACYKVGMKGFLTKPLKLDDLKNILTT